MPQTLTEIRAMLEEAGLRPRKMFGQNFLVDHNLLARLVELAELPAGQAVLEVGPGTGVLTERLLEAAAAVLAVEIDRGLFHLLEQRLAGRAGLRLMHADVLAGKHTLNPPVLQALRELGGQAHLVSNLPYSIATPLVVECLLETLASERGRAEAVRLDRLTFTVQQEVAERFAASPGTEAYGPVSVLVSLLGRCRMGPSAPATAFWPRPQVASRMMRIDFTAPPLEQLPDAGLLANVLGLSFSQRRKKIGSAGRRHGSAFEAEDFASAMAETGINPDDRPERVSAEAFAAFSAALHRRGYPRAAKPDAK